MLENAMDYIRLMNWVVADEDELENGDTVLACLTGTGYVDVIVHKTWFEVR